MKLTPEHRAELDRRLRDVLGLEPFRRAVVQIVDDVLTETCALADAGLLVTDADRAILDAAKAYRRRTCPCDLCTTVVRILDRARREAQR